VKPADLLALLQDVYRDKLVLYDRHVRGAERVAGYEFNNTYQYILNREATHLDWLRSAIEGLGGQPVESGAALAVPAGGKGADEGMAIAEDDARSARAFVERWGPLLGVVTHERHRKMLDLMVGEVREQQRLFQQIAAGQTDVLGRRPAGAGTGGGVMPTRWVE
jgi:hypothetical protein